MMDALSLAIYFGIAFILFGMIAIILQVRNMRKFLEGGEFSFDGMLPIAICAFLSMISAWGFAIALTFFLIFHFQTMAP